MFFKQTQHARRIALFILLLLGGIFLPKSVLAAKVNLSPSAVTLTEGQSQLVTVTLAEPIICPVMDETCEVVISVSTNNEDRTSITDAPITIPYLQWAQSFTFSIAAIDDQLDNGDVTPILTLSTQSNSEYYSDFVPSLTLTVLDNDQTQEASDEPIISQATQASSPPRLPDTGSNQTTVVVLSSLLLFGSGLIRLMYRKYSILG